MEVTVDVDDHVAVDMAAVVAAAIDVAAHQTAHLVVRGVAVGTYAGVHEAILDVIPLHGVPNQFGTSRRELIVLHRCPEVHHLCADRHEAAAARLRCVELITGLQLATHQVTRIDRRKDIVPAFGLDDDILQVQLDAVLNLTRGRAVVGVVFPGIVALLVVSTDDTAVEGGVVGAGLHTGVVAAAHQLVIDNQALVEMEGVLAGNHHAAHITAAIEGTDIAGIRQVVIRIAFSATVKHDVGHQLHGGAFHIAGEGDGVGQGETVMGVVALQQRGGDHLLTVVAQEDVVGNHMGTNLQIHHGILPGILQCGAVTAEIDGTADDGGVLGIDTVQTQQHLLGIRAEGVEGFRRTVGLVIEVTVDIVVHQGGVVGVGVRAVAAAIDIATDARADTHGITAIDLTRHVVAAIDIVDITAFHEHTGCQPVGEVVAGEVQDRRIEAVLLGIYVGHTAAAIEVIHDEGGCRGDLQQQTVGARHGTLVTAAVEVTDLTTLQVPGGTDGHLGQVVAAEEAANLEGTAAGERETGVDAHVKLEAVHRQQLARGILTRDIGRVGDGVDDLRGVIDMDDGLLGDGGLVAAAVGIHDGAALHIQIGLGQVGRVEGGRARSNNVITAFYDIVALAVGQRVTLLVGIGVVAVAAREELADIDGFIRGVHDSRGLDMVGGPEVGISRAQAARAVVLVALRLRVIDRG